MTINMNDEHVTSVVSIAAFTKAAEGMEFRSRGTIEEKYNWIEHALMRLRYFSIKKKAKGEVRKYIALVSGYSISQLTRLILKKRNIGKIKRSVVKRNRFDIRYGAVDIALLLKTDNAHGRISGPATRKILEREYAVFGNNAYENIKRISVSHIYNLRQTRRYESGALTFTKTNPVDRNIGERRKPEPCGKPGYIRVDSVHQGDKDGEKGGCITSMSSMK